jgi:hypothetical protein
MVIRAVARFYMLPRRSILTCITLKHITKATVVSAVLALSAANKKVLAAEVQKAVGGIDS